MDKEKKKAQILLSPKAPVMYPFITIADTKHKSDGVYRVDLILDPKDKEHKGFLTKLKALVPYDENGKPGNPPYKPQLHPETKEPTGKYVVRFKSNFPPKQFDSQKNKIEHDKIMANDSIVKVAFIPNVYRNVVGKTGLKLYLRAVQIFDFKEWFGADAGYYGFEAEEGYMAEPDNPFLDFKSTIPDQTSDKKEVNIDNDLPF
jgi:hypothetical protein